VKCPNLRAVLKVDVFLGVKGLLRTTAVQIPA
jgi:hypothetical protein